MIKTEHICKRGYVGGDFFRLGFDRNINESLDFYLNRFDPNDYYIFKASGFQKLVSFEEFKDFKYSIYMFFKKDIYDLENILKWFEWMKVFGGITYMTKPVPPFDPYEKIKIVE